MEALASPDLDAPVTQLPGVGKARAAMFSDHGIETVRDLLTYLPSRYEDRSQFASVASLPPGEKRVLCLRVVSARLIRTRRRDFTITEGYLKDASGTVKVLWFNRPYLARGLVPDRRVIVFGGAQNTGTGLVMENPDYEILEPSEEMAGSPHFGRIVPVYRRLKSLSGKGVRKLVHETLAVTAPRERPADPRLAELWKALVAAHFPSSEEEARAARRTLARAELLEFQLGLALARRRRVDSAARVAVQPDELRATQERLSALAPFALTSGQSEALARVLADLAEDHPMARLLHGEVGSGKTIVALLSALPIVEAGRQAALLLPTEVLAHQVLPQAEDLLARARLPPVAELLSAARKGADRNQALLRLARGEARLAIGTHALFQEQVAFKDLAYVIVDEQQRFGVFERQALLAKAAGETPHLLVMSATPIPRTLTLTLFGDLDVTRLQEVPPGRQPVATRVLPWMERAQAFQALGEAIDRKEQGFVVVPRVESDEARGRSSVALTWRTIRDKRPSWRAAVLHGKLEAADKAEAAARFRRGDCDVLVATTVVEVGVDAPRATVMIVLHAEGFGLSQLHQLRGRVGRGELPAQCFLVASKGCAPSALKRLVVLEAERDGFRIAEADWDERGPGEVGGARQWGSAAFRVADLRAASEMIDEVRREAADRASAMTGDESGRALARFMTRFGMARVG